MSLRSRFLAKLCLEQGSEAAFLHTQRCRAMEQARVQFSLLQALEERLEAHVEGMLVEPDPVADTAKKLLASEEPSMRYVGLRALGTAGPSPVFWDGLDATPWADAACARAATDALIAVTTPAWSAELATKITKSGGASVAALATAAAIQGLAVAPAIEEAARRATSHLPTLLWALGQLDHAPSLMLLYAHMQKGDGPTRQSAAIAALRIAGGQELVHLLQEQVQSQAWAVLPLALCGGRTAVQSLLQRAATCGVDADTATALGLLGCPSALDGLVLALDYKASAAAAAAALHLLTGAGLFEETVHINEAMLEPDELAELRSGRLDPRRVGTVSTRLSLDPAAWRHWLAQHKQAFAVGTRYRHGRPYTLRAGLDGAMSESLPRVLRDLQAQEVQIRCGVRVGYYSDLPVLRQRERLATASACAGVLELGGWPFDAQLVKRLPGRRRVP